MIAQKRIRQLERIGECLLGEGVVCANPKNLDVQLLELFIVDLPGRQVLRSRGTEISYVKLEENVLPPPELAQADRFSGRTWKRKIRRFVSHLNRKRRSCQTHQGNKKQSHQK